MHDWIDTTWGEVSTLMYGKSLRDYRKPDGDVRVFGTNGPVGWATGVAPLASGPRPVVGRKGAYRGVHLATGDFWVIDTAYWLKPEPDLDPLFSYYRLLMVDINGMDSGSAIPSLNRDHFAALPLLLPPIDEQRRIAAVLGAFDDLIETNRDLSRGLEDRSLALFSGLGFDAAPSDCETVSLSELLEVNPRLPKPTGEAAYVDMASLPTDSSRIANVVRRPAAGGARFQNGDTLLARLTPCLENGKAALVDVLEENEVAVGSTEFLVLRDTGGLGEHWPYLLTRSARFRDYAIQNMNGSSGRQRVSAETIGRYVLRAPDPRVVNDFRQQAAVAFEGISHLNEEIADLTCTRDELLPLLMSGRVRVEDVEGIV